MKTPQSTSKQSHTARGRDAENQVKAYLQSKGWRFIDQNVIGLGGEIDLIFIDHQADQLVFVEVKARSTTQFGAAAEAVTLQKLKRIQRVALYFMQTHPKLPQSGRIDIVSVTSQAHEKPIIEHIENVF